MKTRFYLLSFVFLLLAQLTVYGQNNTELTPDRLRFNEAALEKAFIDWTGTDFNFFNNETGSDRDINFFAANGDIDLDAGELVVLTADDDILFQTGTPQTNRMEIDVAGNISMGTTTPIAGNLLTVNGDIALSNGTGEINFFEGTTKKAFLDYSGTNLTLDNNETNGDLILDAQDAVRIRNAGTTELIVRDNKVGINIGTATPTANLFVRQAAGEEGIALQNDGSGGDIYAFEIGGDDLRIEYNATGGATALISFINEDGAYVDSSDKRLKDNIDEMGNMLDKVMRLRPTTYTFKHVQDKSQKTLGFIAQDVAKVLPGIVRKADGGDHFGLRYDDFGVIAIKAIQELKTEMIEKDDIIEEQTQIITTLEDRLDKIEALLANGAALNQNTNQTNVQLGGADRAYIEQNQPNPFNQNTVIKYFLPEKTKKAQVSFVDATGRVLREVNLTANGLGQINLHTADMPTGVYNYVLVVDGQKIATKKMVLSSNH